MNTEIFCYNEQPVSFRNVDGVVYVNATEMAKPFNKRPNDYLNLQSTKELINALSDTTKNGNAHFQQVMITERGGVMGGVTLFIEDLALDFAMWLDVRFKLWCNDRIRELLRHKVTAINPEDLLTPDMMIRAMESIKKERAEKERYRLQTELQAKQLQESAPKIEYVEQVLQAANNFTTTTIAKELGMSATALNKRLKEMHVQYMIDGHWVLSHKYHNQGYTSTRTHPFIDERGVIKTNILTVWTEKGRQFIHTLFNPSLMLPRQGSQTNYITVK